MADARQRQISHWARPFEANDMITRRLSTRLLLSASAVALIGMLAGAQIVAASGPVTVGLGTAAPFAVLAASTVTNTGPTTITGELGIFSGAAVTGFPPGTVSGAIHKADAVALQAKKDLVTAYNAAAGSKPVTAVPAGKLGGKTLVGGVYSGGTLALTGTLTLDGQNDPNSVWVFQTKSTLITASTSKVALIRGASPCNVFWQVTSSATLGSGSTFVGTIMALTDITMANGVTVNGRALARNGGVTLINDKINNSSCSAASTTGSTKLTYTGPTAAAPGASITLRATLKTSAGVAIAGQTVTFTLNGVTRSAKTSSSGVASVVTTAPTALGTYAIKITSAGVSTSASLRVGNAGLPNSATLATTEVPGSGPTPVVFVGILLLAFVVASRLWLRPIRTR
jgi:hypothetical protein